MNADWKDQWILFRIYQHKLNNNFFQVLRHRGLRSKTVKLQYLNFRKNEWRIAYEYPSRNNVYIMSVLCGKHVLCKFEV